MNNSSNIKPSVSVVMPIFNASQYLKKSLESVCKQTLKNIEIICVNDGSTDDSLSILKNYAKDDSRIKIIDGINHGYGYAMNQGIKHSSGEYIGIVEPDDFIDDTMYESLYFKAKKHNLDVIKSNYYEYHGKEDQDIYFEVLENLAYNKVTNAKEDKNIVVLRPCIWSSIYRRDFLIENNIKFNETPGASYQDTAFAFKIWIFAQRVYFVEEPFLHYRVDNEASSVNSSKKIFSICDEFYNIHTVLNENRELKNEFINILQVLKTNTYQWNELRIADEYKSMFRDQIALEFIKAEYEGNIDYSLFDKAQYDYIQKIIYEFKDKQNYNPVEHREYEIMRNSESYKIGHALMLFPSFIKRKIKNYIQNNS